MLVFIRSCKKVAHLEKRKLLLPNQVENIFTYEILILCEPQFCQDLPNFFSHHEEKVHHVFGFAFEFLAEFGVLSGDAHRASVQVTLTHHGATENEQIQS